MTVAQLAERLNLKLLAGKGGTYRTINGCYIGDLLSWVMGRASEDNVWLTVMGNINAIAVASLADTACIVLTENAALDSNAKQKADEQDIAVLLSEENSYNLAIKIYEALKE